MKKRIVLWAVAVMALGMGVCSCGGDDEYEIYEQGMVGIWRTVPVSGEGYDVVYDSLVSGEWHKHAVQDYVWIEVCANGYKRVKESGTFGHPNGEAANIFDFTDTYHREAWRRTITWLNKEKTSFYFTEGKVFYKIGN